MSLPLLVHGDRQAPFACRQGRIVNVAQFLAQASALAQQFGGAAQILNLCSDRYSFAMGLAAALIAGKPSLLPAAHAPATLRPPLPGEVLCLTDDAALDTPFRKLHPQQWLVPPASATAQMPQIDAAQLAVLAFTSGSTGTPVPHAKSWGSLVRDARSMAENLGLQGLSPRLMLGTVPAQHVYGLEATVLLPMQSGHLLCDERPFFPADVAARLAALPAPRVLVTTPVHLHALLDAGVEVPPLDRVVVSTAPLPVPWAQQAEQQLQCPLLEIYGSTESGQIAVRSTAREQQWTLSRDVRIEIRDGQAWVSGGHTEAAMPLADRIELLDGSRFLLHGRPSDQVNIAGKRSSLGYLNHQLITVPGVVDGVFFHRRDGTGAEAPDDTRLAAMAVAPGCTTADIAAELRRRIDAVFMPRPLLLVERLPRDANGKIPREQLLALRAAHGLQ